MIVDDLKLSAAEGRCELSARVRRGSSEELRLWFSFPEEFAPSRLDGSAFLAGPLVWCMRRGEDLTVDAPVSPRLLASVDDIVAVYRSFFPGEMAAINVSAPGGEPPPPTDVTGSFFSGGVDSWYGVLTALEDDHQTPPLTHLVFSRDFFPRGDWSDEVVRDRAEATRRAAAPTGCRFVEVGTNLKRDFGGAQLTTMALALGFRRILIPSGVMRGELIPGGTHPVLDFRFSSERTEIVHYGDANRLDKTARVAESRNVLETLFVCRVKDDRLVEANCCRCEKCVRTMLGLHIAGALEDAPTFPLPLDPRAVANLRIRPSRRHQWRETMHALGTGRQDRELAAAMRLVIARSDLHRAHKELDEVFSDPELANLAPTLPESIDRARELARLAWLGSEPTDPTPPTAPQTHTRPGGEPAEAKRRSPAKADATRSGMSQHQRLGIEEFLGRGRAGGHVSIEQRETDAAWAHEHSNADGYRLRCHACDWSGEDDGLILDCPREHGPSLLFTEYKLRRFDPDTEVEGLFRYRKWLPGAHRFNDVGGSVTYRSEALGRVTGVSDLWVVFSGYWPEIGARLETATFKDLEARAVLSRLPRRNDQVMVVASAGNTAAACAWACSANGIPVVIVVPQAGLRRLRFPDVLAPCVRIVSLVGSADYADAITLANRLAEVEGFLADGGVRNVARLDGLGTTMLNAAETIGRLPDYYLQAIGSGAGAIAARNAAARLAADGRFGDKLPRFILSQNLPFVPIYLSWKSGRRELIEISPNDAKRQIQQLATPVLSNRTPAYSVTGGIYDLLTETKGDMLVADNAEALDAARLFEEAEGIDIDPAPAVAFATLRKAVRTKLIEPDALVLLNVTGGGRARQERDQELLQAIPTLELDEKEALADEAVKGIAALAR